MPACTIFAAGNIGRNLGEGEELRRFLRKDTHIVGRWGGIQRGWSKTKEAS
jgi:hypothetical protein